ncbi:MAG: hypothetical protein ABII82_18255 [Verrucomicrobiota bacterium]
MVIAFLVVVAVVRPARTTIFTPFSSPLHTQHTHAAHAAIVFNRDQHPQPHPAFPAATTPSGRWPRLRRLKLLCLGRVDEIAPLLTDRTPGWTAFCALIILLGCGLYGTSVGLWRSPLQSAYTGLKIPLLIFLTCAGNALLNGLLGQVLGSGLGFRQATSAIILSFVTAACILGAFSPLAFFILYNTPALASVDQGAGHSITLLTHVGLIAYAGIMANIRLLSLLHRFAPDRRAARTTLLAWLGGNLLLGSQLSWVLRPFIGSPGLPVEFLRSDPLRGNFFEAVRAAIQQLL